VAFIAKLEVFHLDAAIAIEASCFTDPWSRKMLLSEIKDPLALYLAAFDEEDNLTGYAGMKMILDEGHIHNVAVAPLYRRRRVARMLIQALIDHAKDQRLLQLLLEVRAGNEAAIALYHSFGFKHLSTRQNYYNNPREDAVVMMLDLNEL